MPPPPIPPQCQKILSQINSLRAEVKAIQSDPGYHQGPGDPHPGKPDPGSLVEVKKLEGQITAKNSALRSCLLQNVAPFPVKMTVGSIRSIQGTSEIGDDEPYVIVTGVDLSSLVPGLESTLYGPVTMGAGDSKNPGGSPFWALDNISGKTITDPTQVIFIVALMENDDGKPSAARGLVKASATVSLVGSVGSPRAVRVQKLVADIDSALDIPTGAPNFDDRIGNAQELKPSKIDLVLPILGAHTIPLIFSGDGKFQVECVITAA